MISQDEIRKDCKDELCRIRINLSAKTPGDEIEYDIIVFSTNSIPIYLTRGEYRLDAVKKKGYQYSY